LSAVYRLEGGLGLLLEGHHGKAPKVLQGLRASRAELAQGHCVDGLSFRAVWFRAGVGPDAKRGYVRMKWLLTTVLLISAIVFALGQAVLAVDEVDIGDPASEAGYNLVGWGPIEPANSGGTFGGIDDCRTIYFPPAPPDENWATLDLDFGPAGEKCLDLWHLDGMSGSDDFEVFVNDAYVGGFVDPGAGGETWILSSFDVSGYAGTCTVKLVSTKPPWEQFDPYGQVAFDRVRVGECGPTGVDETTWGSIKALYE